MVQHGTLAFFNFNFYPSLIQCVALSLGPGQEVNEADEEKTEVKILVCFPVRFCCLLLELWNQLEDVVPPVE